MIPSDKYFNYAGFSQAGVNNQTESIAISHPPPGYKQKLDFHIKYL